MPARRRGRRLASHRTWIFNNPACWRARWQTDAYSAYDNSAGEERSGRRILFNTDQPLDKLTFVYKTPGTIVNSGFDYELKNIELP